MSTATRLRPRWQAAAAVAVGALGLIAAVTACSGSDAEASGETRQVTDAFGAVEVPAEPQRVIADSVSTYAHLVSLGVTPIGVALPVDISPDYISEDAGEMTNVVAEDGWTIDVEEALTLRPDLIVGVGADYNLENCERYRGVAPTFCFVESYGTVQDVKDTLQGIAVALGREDALAEAVADYDTRVAELRTRVEASGLADQRVGNVRFDASGFVGIRVGQTGNAVLASLGITEPEWPAANEDDYVVLSEETLELLDQADVLIVNTDDNVVLDDLAVLKSALWQNLEIVKGDRVRFASAWNGADLPQLERILDDIERELIEPAEANG